MVGALITEKSAETKHGQTMEFITLEDITALYDATLFPEVYRRCCHLLSPNRPYVVRGLAGKSFGVATLTVLALQLLEPTIGNERHRLARHEYVDAHELFDRKRLYNSSSRLTAPSTKSIRFDILMSWEYALTYADYNSPRRPTLEISQTLRP